MKEITSSTEFIKKSIVLMSKLSKDTVFKTRLLNFFNIGADYIKESLSLCENAQTAEDEYEKETKEALMAKMTSEKTFKAADFIFRKHTSFLKLLLKYDIKKLTALGLIGIEELKNKEEWFDYALDVYEKMIGDSSAAAMLGEYKFTLTGLQQGRQSIVAARDANTALAKESSEAKEAMNKKDYTFNEMYDRMQFIQYFCYYIFLDEPKKFKQLGLPIIDNDTGALINIRVKDMVKEATITKDMVKDASIT